MRAMATASRTAAKAPRPSATRKSHNAPECAKNTQPRTGLITRFDRGVIVEVRAYLDSAMVTELFHQNPIA